jgi:hypothetical protein
MNTPLDAAALAPFQRVTDVTSLGAEEAEGGSRPFRVRGCTQGIEQMLLLMAGVVEEGHPGERPQGPPASLLRPLDAATGFSAWAIEEVSDRAVRVELAGLRGRRSLLDLGFVEAVASGRTGSSGTHPAVFQSDRYLLGALVAGLCEVATAVDGGVRGFVGASLQDGFLILRVRGSDMLKLILEPVATARGLRGAIAGLRIHTIQRAMGHLNALCIQDDSALPTTQLEIQIPVG